MLPTADEPYPSRFPLQVTIKPYKIGEVLQQISTLTGYPLPAPK